MNPTVSNVHVDAILSNISIAYRNEIYIAEKTFPLVRVDKKSDKYYIFDRGHWFRDEAQYRAPGAASEGAGFTLSTDRYECEEIAFHTLLEDEVRDNADDILSIETAKTNFVTDKILLKLERLVADICTTTGNWGSNHTTLTGTDQWSDYDNSDPIADIETGIDTVQESTGMLVNRIVMGRPVWRVLKHHPQLLDRLPVTGLRTARLEHLAEIIGVKDILIGEALYNDSKRGGSDDFNSVWGKDVWMGHVASGPAKETPTAGYTFVWPRDGGQIRGIRRWRVEDIHSDKIEGFMSLDTKVVGTELGYVIKAAVA